MASIREPPRLLSIRCQAPRWCYVGPVEPRKVPGLGRNLSRHSGVLLCSSVRPWKQVRQPHSLSPGNRLNTKPIYHSRLCAGGHRDPYSIDELGGRLCQRAGQAHHSCLRGLQEPQHSSRLALAVQRGNAAAVLGTFAGPLAVRRTTVRIDFDT